MEFTFGKQEKLKSRKAIEVLFLEGKYIKAFPVRLVYLQQKEIESSHFKVGFSVSKRHFKRAVDRNRIKRLLREAYRLHKHILSSEEKKHYIGMFIYGDKAMPTFAIVEEKIKEILEKLQKKIER